MFLVMRIKSFTLSIYPKDLMKMRREEKLCTY